MRSVSGPQAARVRLEAASRWRVLGQKWEDNLNELRKAGKPIDLIVFTGDLGDWGHPSDYPKGIAFLQSACTTLDVPFERLFIIPGNHDIDRKIHPDVWTSLRTDIAANPLAISRWMAGEEHGALHNDERRNLIVERERAFWNAIKNDLGRTALASEASPHRRLGYRYSLSLPDLTQPIHIIGLDTAWLAGEKNDSGQLWLTEHQVSLLTTTEDGEPLPGFRLALMHHRFADLADGDQAKRLMADRVDLLLHGHQHKPTSEILTAPDHQLLVLATGCLYEGDEGYRYPNACQLIDLRLDAHARPIDVEIRFRGWSDKGMFWGDDALLYEKARNGRLRFHRGTQRWTIHSEEDLKDAIKSSKPPPRAPSIDGQRGSQNVLGELTAEADTDMLETAFYESRGYRELIGGKDYRFVVGRRGTGKSALFHKLEDALFRQKRVLLLSERPPEEKTRVWHEELGKLTNDYSEARTIAKLAWKVQVLTQALDQITNSYRADRAKELAKLVAYRVQHSKLFGYSGLARGLEAFRTITRNDPAISATRLPEAIAEHFGVSQLQNIIAEALPEIGRHIVFLYDGLDEGWLPTKPATALLGGLAKLAAEFRESQGIHCILFIRDNMFRALAEFDDDFSRNIEGSAFRLHWDEQSLLSLVALRLRTAFNWDGDNDVKTWNRFAKRGLENMVGFRKCLKLTLYRPRDVISLLNSAYKVASHSSRNEIIDDDIEAAATSISQARLSDLYKEYEKVLPGLRYFAEEFRGQSAAMPYGLIRIMLNTIIKKEPTGSEARDFALIATDSEAFRALYSVGFLGIRDPLRGIRFCHDGSNADIGALAEAETVVVHPCYWRALDLRDGDEDATTVSVDDEEDIVLSKPGKQAIIDMRLRKLGSVIAELDQIPVGASDGHQFEEWAFYTIKYLMPSFLEGIEWHSVANGIRRRYMIGTLKESRLERRLVKDYESERILIAINNSEQIDKDWLSAFLTAASSDRRFCLWIVDRSSQEYELTGQTVSIMRDAFQDNPTRPMLLLPAKLLVRALKKMRSKREDRDDYILELLEKRLHLFERNCVPDRRVRAKRMRTKKRKHQQ